MHANGLYFNNDKKLKRTWGQL